MASVIEKNGEKYYSSNQLMSYGYMINIICGTRAAGKSFDVKRHVMHRLITNPDSHFMFLVKDIKDAQSRRVRTYWNDICSLKGPYPDYTMERKGMDYYLKNNVTGEKRQVGIIVCLKEADDEKSSVFPCDMAILEEFINGKGEYHKTPDDPDYEASELSSLISTYFRDVNNKFNDKGKVFLISNAYSVNNPYFRYWGFMEQILDDPFHMFYKNKEQSVIMERTDIADVDYKMSKGNKASANKWTDFSNQLKLTKSEGKRKPILQLSLDGENWISMCSFKDTYLFYKDNYIKNKDLPHFSCSEFKMFDVNDISVFYVCKWGKEVELLFNMNQVYYDNRRTYIILRNIFDF